MAAAQDAAAAKLLVLTTRAHLADADTRSALADVDEIDAQTRYTEATTRANAKAGSRRWQYRPRRPVEAGVGEDRQRWTRRAGTEAATTVTVAPRADRSNDGVAAD